MPRARQWRGGNRLVPLVNAMRGTADPIGGVCVPMRDKSWIKLNYLYVDTESILPD